MTMLLLFRVLHLLPARICMVKYIKRHLVCQEDLMEEDNNTKHPCLE